MIIFRNYLLILKNREKHYDCLLKFVYAVFPRRKLINNFNDKFYEFLTKFYEFL